MERSSVVNWGTLYLDMYPVYIGKGAMQFPREEGKMTGQGRGICH